MAIAGRWSCFPNNKDATSLILCPTIMSKPSKLLIENPLGTTKPAAVRGVLYDLYLED